MIDIKKYKENIMKVKDIIKQYHMPCNSMQELYSREEILEMESKIKEIEKDIEYLEYLEKTEYSHNNGHYADEQEYDEEHYYYDEFDHIHVIDD